MAAHSCTQWLLGTSLTKRATTASAPRTRGQAEQVDWAVEAGADRLRMLCCQLGEGDPSRKAWAAVEVVHSPPGRVEPDEAREGAESRDHAHNMTQVPQPCGAGRTAGAAHGSDFRATARPRGKAPIRYWGHRPARRHVRDRPRRRAAFLLAQRASRAIASALQPADTRRVVRAAASAVCPKPAIGDEQVRRDARVDTRMRARTGHGGPARLRGCVRSRERSC
jgi:hypothetical protein